MHYFCFALERFVLVMIRVLFYSPDSHFCCRFVPSLPVPLHIYPSKTEANLCMQCLIILPPLYSLLSMLRFPRCACNSRFLLCTVLACLLCLVRGLTCEYCALALLLGVVICCSSFAFQCTHIDTSRSTYIWNGMTLYYLQARPVSIRRRGKTKSKTIIIPK